MNNGNLILLETLHHFGINSFSGVNGGGLVHITKYLTPLTRLAQIYEDRSYLLTMSEYSAGFIPIGYYLASGRISAAMATTGAAIKLLCCGLTDAKIHNIPALYLIALNPSITQGKSPLQDVSAYGMNIIPQLQAELSDGCIVIDDPQRLIVQLQQAHRILKQSRPVAIAFHPDILTQATTPFTPEILKSHTVSRRDINNFMRYFVSEAKNRRIILYVCSEAARCNSIKNLITLLSETLHAPTLWSVNGANAVAFDNRYGYGHILFGGNDKAIALWNSITQDDVLITLGFDSGEYALNLESLKAGVVWHLTHLPQAYGYNNGTIKHRIMGKYHRIYGDIALVLQELLPYLQQCDLGSRPFIPLLKNFNTRRLSHRVEPGCVDLIAFYRTLQQLWQPNSIGFDDVCVAYKDRQYVMQRPHPHIRFYNLADGSAMGASFGLGVGAKIANPNLHTFIFTGDGCWRLFGGALADAAHFDLRLFVINNACYALVEQGLNIILPTYKSHFHCNIAKIDFVAAAKAQGWDGIRLKPDLSNLKKIMKMCYSKRHKSLLIEIPADSKQIIGLNSRIIHVTEKFYL